MKPWILLLAGPLSFLLEIVAASAYFSIRKVPPEEIPGRISALAPHLLVGMFLSFTPLLFLYSEDVKKAWSLPGGGKLWADIGIGVAVGVALAVLYLGWLAPVLEMLQRRFGDFVPPGSVLPSVSKSLVLFFLANVLEFLFAMRAQTHTQPPL